MRLAEFFIHRTTITVVLLLVVFLGGLYAYTHLGRFEDPEFVIRNAVVMTPYPGARPGEVAEEVTEVIESAVQQLQELETVKSVSRAGMSEVTVEMDRAYSATKEDLQQLWSKLRNRLRDAERDLPPGAGPILVNDDFGDVYALFYAVTGEGYSQAEIMEYVEDVRKELLLVPGVAKVAFLGAPQEAVFVEISQARASQMGIPPEAIYRTLEQQNAVTPAGSVRVGPEYIEIAPVGGIESVQAIGDLLIAGEDGANQVRLSDVATISRGYREPPPCRFWHDGRPAIGLGVSNVSGGNVVAMGDAVRERLAHLESLRPVGMELRAISNQSDSVRIAVAGFMNNLIAAVVIVVVTLLVFMGTRSGVIIGIVLVLTVCATLIVMYSDGIFMQRISLGALIIALGMLVDNAIVVTEGILVRIQLGEERVRAAKEVARTSAMPLLGGTVVGALAFSAIGFSPDNTGEYAGSLFWVILYSLMLSWVFAIAITPFLCVRLLKTPEGERTQDAYDNAFLRMYQHVLRSCLRRRWMTTAVLCVLLAGALIGFGFVPAGFFPESTRPQFVVDYWLPQGTHIDRVGEDLLSLETWVRKLDGVTHVTTISGQGALRFMLTYGPESPNSSYGQLLIDVEDYRQIPALITSVQDRIRDAHPDAQAKAWKFVLGPGGGSKVEAVFKGPEPGVLRQLATQTQEIMASDGGAVAIKDDWRQRTRLMRPVFSESQARRAGVTRVDLCNALETAYTGRRVGLHREGDKLLPVIARLPESERGTVDTINEVQVYASALGAFVPIRQIVSGFETVTENAILRREDRFFTIKAQCDPGSGELTSKLFARLRPQIEALQLPPGYSIEWGGEYGDSQKAQKGLVSTLPFGIGAMVLVVILLFNSVRQPLIIWLTVPLSIIGVTVGLLVFRAPFEFMAILGFLSLAGMLIKNAIVLVDQIDLEIREGKEPFAAILSSAVSRVRPVCMGSLTTVFGVAPLLLDPFFRSMAVTIMFGLTFATVLTLLVVPVLYAMFFNIREMNTAP